MEREDLRVIRTKKLLTDALKTLLQEKCFDKITVNDICDKALVHRATFYNHFTDKIDLLNYIFDEMQDVIYQKTLKLENVQSPKLLYSKIIEMILDHCITNRDGLRLILKNSTQEFQAILIENIKHGILYLISKNKDISHADTIFESVESFFTGGFSAVCIQIVLSDKQIEKAKLLAYLENVLDATFNFVK